MELVGRDIICLSNHYWHERRYRKQEFMGRFAKCNRVLFVEPSFSMARQPEPHLAPVARNRFFRPEVEDICRNLYVFRPPRALPKWSDPHIEVVNYRWYGQLIARAARRLQF